MNEQVVDLSFVDRLDEIASRRNRIADSLRESFQLKMNHLHNDADGALTYVKDLMKQRADVSKELAQLDQYINDITLAVGLVKHAAARMAETPTQFWQE